MNTTVVEPGIAITQATHDATLGVLTQVLSDEHVVYMKLRNYHWNVEGAHHRELHALFAEQYRIIEVRIDEVAERITTLGGIARGTVRCAAESSQLDEFPPETSDGMQTIELVADRLVGQPRDGDPRAAYAVYDDEDQTVTFHRVEYDVAGASAAILGAGLPQALALRLHAGW